MKKAPAQKKSAPVKRAVKRPAKSPVKHAAKRATKMTQHAAALALADLKEAVSALKKSKTAKEGKNTVKAALNVATKLNRVVKGMKSAQLI